MRTLRSSDCAAFDCSEEFSLHNLLHVRKLVEDAEIPGSSEELVYRAETGKHTKKTVSEVKPTAADQHFARNVV